MILFSKLGLKFQVPAVFFLNVVIHLSFRYLKPFFSYSFPNRRESKGNCMLANGDKSLRMNRKCSVIRQSPSFQDRVHWKTSQPAPLLDRRHLGLVREQDVQELFSYRLVCLFLVYNVVQRSYLNSGTEPCKLNTPVWLETII